MGPACLPAFDRPRTDLPSIHSRGRLRADTRARICALSALCGALLARVPAAAQAPASASERARTTDAFGAVELGFDSFFQTFRITGDLVLDETSDITSRGSLRDTTDTFTEARALFELGLRKQGGAHAWTARSRLSLGTDLYREALLLEYRYRPPLGPARADVSIEAEGRQFRPGSDFSLSSDYGRLVQRGRVRRSIGEGMEVGLSQRLEVVDFRDRSEFEIDNTRFDLAATLGGSGERLMLGELELGGGFREVPDSSGINYRRAVAAGDFSLLLSSRLQVDAGARAERRVYQDEQARSPFWDVGADPTVRLRLSERWELAVASLHEWMQYDAHDTAGVFFDQWAGRIGVRVERALGAWRLSLEPRWAWLTAPGEVEDEYVQPSAVLEVELFSTGRLWFSASGEFGRRRYADGGGDLDLYSDYTFLRSTLVGSWTIWPRVSLNAFVSDEPEAHRDDEDDSRLTLVNLALRVEL